MLKFLRVRGRRTAAIWWLVIIATAITFVIGFSVAPNLVGGGSVAGTTVLGEVDGEPITQSEYQQTIAQATENYRAQFGGDPDERDLAFLREQAWVQLVTEKALLDEARRLGFRATDPEVLFAVKNTPPQWVRAQPTFQTNGQFDFAKYQSAQLDPNLGPFWSAVEGEVRRVLPAQKLEEMMLATAKFSEPELRRAFVERNEKAAVTVARWGPAPVAPDTNAVDEATLRTFYEGDPALFTGPEELRAQLVTLPRTVLPEDEEQAQALARSLVEQARGGADFTQLARDMSTGPLSSRGGDMGVFPLSRVPAALQRQITSLGDSAITDPIREGDRYFIYRIARAGEGEDPNFHLWQILIPVEPSESARTQDIERIQKLRDGAERKGLGVAASEMGFAAQEVGWYSATSAVPELAALPQALQFGLTSPEGSVSPAYQAGGTWNVLQVVERRPAGLRPFETVRDQVEIAYRRQQALAEAERQARAARSAIAAGAPFEATAREHGALQVQSTEPRTRLDAWPPLGGAPEAIGIAFGLAVGAIAEPVVHETGIYLIRKDAAEPAPFDQYDELKAQVSQQLLQSRQQERFSAWLDWYRRASEVDDRRGDLYVIQ